jgi:hypothetical protein
MTTVYVRRFDLKDSLTDSEVSAYWRSMMEEFLPAIRRVAGVRSARVFSGAGALRADLRIVLELDHGGVYETLLHEPGLHDMIVRFYAPINMRTSTQQFVREITPELVRAIGS